MIAHFQVNYLLTHNNTIRGVTYRVMIVLKPEAITHNATGSPFFNELRHHSYVSYHWCTDFKLCINNIRTFDSLLRCLCFRFFNEWLIYDIFFAKDPCAAAVRGF